MFFSAGREILRINIGRRDMRVYVHPPAGALFDFKAKFTVKKNKSLEKFVSQDIGQIPWNEFLGIQDESPHRCEENNRLNSKKKRQLVRSINLNGNEDMSM
jgi:hypothetical protein